METLIYSSLMVLEHFFKSHWIVAECTVLFLLALLIQRDVDQLSQDNLDLRCMEILYSANMEINEWILDARTRAKMTQTQLGDALSVTRGNVSAWENGRHEPSWSQILNICRLTKSRLPLPEEWEVDISSLSAIEKEMFDGLSEVEKIELKNAFRVWFAKWKNRKK